MIFHWNCVPRQRCSAARDAEKNDPERRTFLTASYIYSKWTKFQYARALCYI